MEKSFQAAGSPVKVAITGPESSGKTSLTKWLAHAFNDLWLPEYARYFLNNLERPYTLEDVHEIARVQLGKEAEYLPLASRILFCDTDAIVLKIWFQEKYGVFPHYLRQWLEETRYDHHLLLRPDIPYKADPLRENPEKGEYLFKKFEESLNEFSMPYTIIEGSNRKEKARETVCAILNTQAKK